MAEQPITKPNAVTFALEDIVAEVLQGRVRIPDFQRKFRWQWDDVRRLLDSIVRGYPIGSLLLWQRPAESEELVLGALKIDAPSTKEALWVVDGQQRLTSIASTLNDEGSADPRFSASYDLANSTFERTTGTHPHTVPLPIIFDLQRLLRWFSKHPESGEYFDKATGIAKAIRQYTIPAYIVKQQDESVLRDIFDRMNNYGMRLTRAEVFSALHAGKGRHGPPHTFGDIVDYIDVTHGFGQLDEDTVLRCILARRGPDVTRDIRREFDSERVSREFPKESVETAYRGGRDALSAAVKFLQEDASVPHFGFLTYRYLLVVLTRFFAHHQEPSIRNRELLRRWYWRASMVGPGKFGGWTPAMRALTARIASEGESESIQSLLRALDTFPLEIPSVGRFRTNAAYSRMLLCAMWALSPRSTTTGAPYDREMLAKALQGRDTAIDIVFEILRRAPAGLKARASNRFILLRDDVVEEARSYFRNPPLNIPSGTWTDTLESHCLNGELCTDLAAGRDAEFLAKRETILISTLSSFLARSTESDFEDTPPLASLDIDDDDDDDDDDQRSLEIGYSTDRSHAEF